MEFKRRSMLAWLSDIDRGCRCYILAKLQLVWQQSTSVLCSYLLIRYCMQAIPMMTYLK